MFYYKVFWTHYIQQNSGFHSNYFCLLGNRIPLYFCKHLTTYQGWQVMPCKPHMACKKWTYKYNADAVQQARQSFVLAHGVLHLLNPQVQAISCMWLLNHTLISKGISGLEVDCSRMIISLKNCIFPRKSYSQAVLPQQFCTSCTQYRWCLWVEQVYRIASLMKIIVHCLHWRHSSQQSHCYRNAALASFKGHE